MKDNIFESAASNQETFSKEQWQEKLQSAKEKYQQVLAQASDFYDEELCEVYKSSALQFGADSDAQRIYINLSGDNYDEAVKNYKQFRDFQREQLGPIDKEISDISAEINKIRNKEADERERQTRLDKEEKFQAEKKELINALYEALDVIHSQIPDEAQKVGMTAEMALKTYLPELSYKAERIEGYIKRAEEVRTYYDINNLKRNLEGDDIFEK